MVAACISDLFHSKAGYIEQVVQDSRRINVIKSVEIHKMKNHSFPD